MNFFNILMQNLSIGKSFQLVCLSLKLWLPGSVEVEIRFSAAFHKSFGDFEETASGEFIVRSSGMSPTFQKKYWVIQSKPCKIFCRIQVLKFDFKVQAYSSQICLFMVQCCKYGAKWCLWNLSCIFSRKPKSKKFASS